MSAITLERGTPPSPAKPDRSLERMPGGIALSAGLHIGLFILILLGLPNLFRHPPAEDIPIAVDLVTIAPETHATHTNPFRPVPDAKPDPAVAPPAPKPEAKPEPPAPTPAPSASAPPPPPPPPKPELKTAAVPPPPPPKPVEAQALTPPPPQPKPHAEPQRTLHHMPRAEPKKSDPQAFEKLLKNLEAKQPQAAAAPKPQAPEKRPQPAAFDSLLKNLTHEQVAQADDAPLQPHKQTAAALPSSQPKAPLGAQLTASEMDRLREQLYQCWNVPVGARDAKDMVIEIRVIVGPDGVAQQARIVDQSRLGDPVFRAAAESARRTFFAPECTPLRVPAGKYEVWKDMVVDFSPKDLL